MRWLSHLLYTSGYQKKVNDKAITIPVDALIISAARCTSPWYSSSFSSSSLIHHLLGFFFSYLSSPPFRFRNRTLSKLFLPWLPSADKQDKLRRMLADTHARKIISQPGPPSSSPSSSFHHHLHHAHAHATGGLGVEVFEELLRLLKSGGLTRPIQPINGGEVGPWTKYNHQEDDDD